MRYRARQARDNGLFVLFIAKKKTFPLGKVFF
jgi:hypothetical protein